MQASALSLSHLTRRDALRRIAFTAGAAALPGSAGLLNAIAQAATPSPTVSPTPAPVVSHSLGPKLSWIRGLGGNIAVLAGADGVLAVDSGLPDLVEKTSAEIERAGKIAHLVNTHWHYDHTGGNELFGQAGAHITAHENCRRRLTSDQFIEAFDRKVPATAASGWPRTTFTGETTLHVNGEDIHLLPVPPAHTDGDVIVRFAKADVIHGGDLFFNGNYPFIDYSSGGWLGGMVAAIKTLAEMTTAKSRIIPGHGPLATPEDLRAYLAFLETMFERLAKLKDEGRSVDEVVAAAPAKEFDEKLGKGFIKPEQFVRITYTGLLRRQ